MERLSLDKRRKGCPTCYGVDAKSCLRCEGKTRMCDWVHTESGWTHDDDKSFGEGE